MGKYFLLLTVNDDGRVIFWHMDAIGLLHKDEGEWYVNHDDADDLAIIECPSEELNTLGTISDLLEEAKTTPLVLRG